MKKQRLAIPVLLFVFVFSGVALTGCNTKPDRGTVPVTISVTYQGKPVEAAAITLLAEGRYAVGATNAQGISRLFTYEPNDGALPGQYAVAIDKHETIFPDAPVSAAADTGRPQVVQHIYHIPQKYGNTATSGLSLEVVKGQKNEFTFELK